MIGGREHGVKKLTLSYMQDAASFELAPGAVMVQILGVRWVGLIVCLAASTAMASPRSSNPAFLGIRMQDAGGRGPCMIEGATHESPAEIAGLRSGDLVLTVDGKPIGTCSVLLDEITAHAPGDAVQIKVQRLGAAVVTQVQLTTRDALLHKVIGKPMVATDLVGVEDGTTYDLSSPHGRMAIIGLYNPACVDCASLFTKFLDWSREKARKGGPQALVLAVSAGESIRDLKVLQNSLDVPLATGEFLVPGQDPDSSPFSRELVISDRDRLGVMVIDGRGIVQYVGPIAPNSEDTEAVLDELFAVADQAARRSS
jgi:membrane-associated protease RseP (regulator of RpoE activity)